MIGIVVFGILVSNVILCQQYVLPSSKQSDDNDEERLVVQKLASIIRQQEESQLENNENDLENDEVLHEEAAAAAKVAPLESSFTYEAPKPITSENRPPQSEPPFAVPPSDFRFFRSDFSVNEANPKIKEDSSNTRPKNYEKITILSSAAKQDTSLGEKEQKSEDTKKDELERAKEDAVQRRKLYSHFMLNPSFIPYGGQAKSILVPDGTYYEDKNTTNFLALTYGTMSALLVLSAVIAFSIYKKLRKKVKDAEDVGYPAYGVTGPSKETAVPTGDRHLAHSAQVYHYQHKKHQMKAMEKGPNPTITRKGTESGSEDDDLAVYECPGLAPVTGEMEVKNPMFTEENDVKPSSSPKETKEKKAPSNANKKSNK